MQNPQAPRRCRCSSVHRFCACSEHDSDSSCVEAAVAACRAAAHRAEGKKQRPSLSVAAIQCDLLPEEAPPTPKEVVEEPAPLQEKPVKGELNIQGNVLLATDWDLVDDDVRFEHYPLLSLECCGAHQHRQHKFWHLQQQQQQQMPHLQHLQQLQQLQQQQQRSRRLPRRLLRAQEEALRQQRLQRIPKHREAFPVLEREANPEVHILLKNRVRKTYDHAHSLPLHTDDSYLRLHATRQPKSKLLQQQLQQQQQQKQQHTVNTSRKYDIKTCCTLTTPQNLLLDGPVCCCPRVIPKPSCCSPGCCAAAPLWSVRTPHVVDPNYPDPCRVAAAAAAAASTPTAAAGEAAPAAGTAATPAPAAAAAAAPAAAPFCVSLSSSPSSPQFRLPPLLYSPSASPQYPVHATLYAGAPWGAPVAGAPMAASFPLPPLQCGGIF
ncbi:hypothetical protein, conserved [Eimeria acervulina]|uniref:Uncharacterized protein n=1 Tax=Eimeria acervulina TaxID=5801 RepID=U6GVA8_EIMAC|nr:hypothetical protein, conserved [Eimeria acervulina]CDI84105.1 hypothetical protein, conserved [Eimeria acervulina]